MCTCFTAPKKGQPNGILAVMSMVIVMSKHIVRVISGLFVKIPMWVGIGAAKEAGGNQALFLLRLRQWQGNYFNCAGVQSYGDYVSSAPPWCNVTDTLRTKGASDHQKKLVIHVRMFELYTYFKSVMYDNIRVLCVLAKK